MSHTRSAPRAGALLCAALLATTAFAQDIPQDATLPTGSPVNTWMYPEWFVAHGNVVVASELLPTVFLDQFPARLHVSRRAANGDWVNDDVLSDTSVPGVVLQGGQDDFDVDGDWLVARTTSLTHPLAVFHHSNGSWSQTQLLAEPGATAPAYYLGVALDGPRLVALKSVRTGGIQQPMLHSPVLDEYRFDGSSWMLVASSVVGPPESDWIASMQIDGDRAFFSQRDSLSFFEVKWTALQRDANGTWSATHSTGNFGFDYWEQGAVLSGDDLYVAAQSPSRLMRASLSTPGPLNFVEVFPMTVVASNGWLITLVAASEDEIVSLIGDPTQAVVVHTRDSSGVWSLETRFVMDSPIEPGFKTFVTDELVLHSSEVPLTGPPFPPNPTGHADLHAFSRGTLQRGTLHASLAAQGTQPLLLRGSAERAGWLYFVLGSMSGTTPSMSLAPGVALPLVDDPYFQMALWASAPITNAFGMLDANGRAAAEFFVPPGTSPSFAGLSVHHAYVAIDPVTYAAHASNAVRVDLVP
jgi:hypothetical protein